MSSDFQARSAAPLPLTAPPRSLTAIANDRDAVVRLLAQISRIRSSVHGTFELVAASCEQPQAGLLAGMICMLEFVCPLPMI
jgi:hypothetical protein